MNLLKRLRPVANFKSGLLPILQSLSNYHSVWSANISTDQFTSLDNLRDAIITCLLDKHEYPEWVFDLGFNPGLRAGFRFFLIKLDQVVEVIFSINYLVHRKIAAELMQPLTSSLIEVINRNNELIQAMSLFFKEGIYPATDASFTEDMSKLELTMQQHIPQDLEALGISPNYIAVTNLVRNMRDMRQLLIELLMSLPKPEINNRK